MTSPNNLVEDLFLQWRSLWSCLQVNELFVNQFGINQVAVNQTFTKITTEYSTPERHYHNLEHIHHVLQLIQTLQYQTQDLPVVQLAAWFHDVVYDSKADDNEENSANYANLVLTSLNISPSVITKVTALILNTKHHQPTLNGSSEVLLDADLGILGAIAIKYREYMLAIRQEYSWVSDKEYSQGRIKILENFLRRPRIYFTQEMFHKLESAARSNISDEIQYLKSQP